MTNHMLTTVDNPYDPFTQFDEWRVFDETHGYHTLSYLARIARTSDEFPEPINDEEIEKAIDEIVRLNILGLYRKVQEPATS